MSTFLRHASRTFRLQALRAAARLGVARGAFFIGAVALSFMLIACGGGDDPSPAPFAIVAQPVDTSVVAGQRAAFNVDAPGATGYQWQASLDSGATWADIAGATAASFTADVAALDGTRYRVIVSAPSGARSTSSAVRLTVTGALVGPAITVQPSDQTALVGQGASFNVTATGTAPAYQWQASTDAGATYVDVPGAVQATLSLSAVALADNGKRLRVTISNGVGATVSLAATLSVQPVPASPTFTLQASDVSVAAPGAASFTVAVAGNPAPSLQWQLSTNAGVTFVDIAGATSPTLTLATTGTALSGNRYRATASNSVAATTGNAAVLTVTAMPVAPAFTLQPVGASVTVPSAATFSVVVTATPTATLQWQQSVDGGTTFNNINGATSSTYTTPASTAGDDGKRYRAIATNAAGSLASSAATLNVAVVTVTSIGPAGGTVIGPNGTQLVIPAGALATTIGFAITQSSTGAPALPATGFTAIGAVYTISPHGTVFAVPASVRIPYDPAAITTGATPQLLKAEPGGAFAGVASTINGSFVEADIGNLSYFAPAVNGLLRFSDIQGKCGRESLTGTIWCWGDQGSIAFGSGVAAPGTGTVFPTPTRLSTLAFSEFVTGADSVCGVHGVDVYCIGDSEITREANPPAAAHWVLLPLPPGVHLHRLAAAGTSVCGITVGSGTAYCWGGNLGGVLGRGQLGANSSDPAAVTGAHTDYQVLAGGGLSFCALRGTGSLECWGRADQGQIPGLSGFFNPSPVPVTGISLDPRAGALSAGASHFCGIRVNGSVVCWGENFNGQIGIGTAGSGNSADPNEHVAPTTVPGLTLASLRLASATSCGLGSSGNLSCWGDGTSGQLGNGTHPNKQTTPVAVATPFFTLIRLSGADLTMCGLTSTAEAYCWGSNTYADLGSNLPPPPSSDIPVKVWDIGPFPSLP